MSAIIISFCNKNTEEIRNFLNVYCKERIEAGFIPIEDPSMSAFYDALCTGMDWTEVSNDVDDDLGPRWSSSLSLMSHFLSATIDNFILQSLC